MASLEIEKLINEIFKLPGFGRRAAQRIALYLLKNKRQSLLPLVQSLKEANEKIINCETCGNIDTISPCSLFINSKRDMQTICVVEDLSDLWTFERIGFYKGMYHVLGGSLSAINGVGTNDLSISKLLNRIKKQSVKEVVLALSTTIEGQTTAHYIQDSLKKTKVKISKLAQGLPVGGEIEFLDDGTLFSAFKNRAPIIND